MATSTNNSSLCQGPLTGEVTLSNGSIIVFKSEDWDFSWTSVEGSIIRAKEKSPVPTIVNCNHANWREQEELKSRIAHREMLLEDAKKLLDLYAEACPWEDSLGATKEHVVGCIERLDFAKETIRRYNDSKE